MVWCKVSSVYIFPSKSACTLSYISPIANKFQLIISRPQAFSFKNHLIKSCDCSSGRDLFLHKVHQRNICIKKIISKKSKKNIYKM